MTLELKFAVQSRGLTWTFEALNKILTLMSEAKVTLEGLKFQVLSRSLNLRFEVKVWSRRLDFKFKVEVRSESLKLKFKLTWKWPLQLIFEEDI